MDSNNHNDHEEDANIQPELMNIHAYEDAFGAGLGNNAGILGDMDLGVTDLADIERDMDLIFTDHPDIQDIERGLDAHAANRIDANNEGILLNDQQGNVSNNQRPNDNGARLERLLGLDNDGLENQDANEQEIEYSRIEQYVEDMARETNIPLRDQGASLDDSFWPWHLLDTAILEESGPSMAHPTWTGLNHVELIVHPNLLIEDFDFSQLPILSLDDFTSIPNPRHQVHPPPNEEQMVDMDMPLPPANHMRQQSQALVNAPTPRLHGRPRGRRSTTLHATSLSESPPNARDL